MRSNVIIVAGLLLSAAIVMATLRPVRFQAEKKVTHHGIVAEVYQTALKDLVVKLKGRPEIYYLDKKAEHEIDFEAFKTKLLDQPVSIHYAERWKPLSEKQPQHYVSKVETEDEIVFAE